MIVNNFSIVVEVTSTEPNLVGGVVIKSKIGAVEMPDITFSEEQLVKKSSQELQADFEAAVRWQVEEWLKVSE